MCDGGGRRKTQRKREEKKNWKELKGRKESKAISPNVKIRKRQIIESGQVSEEQSGPGVATKQK